MDQEQRYFTCLASLNEIRNESDANDISNQKIIAEYKQRLEERIAEVKERTEEFRSYKRNVAATAENSRTGKPLPEKTVEQLESTDRKKENEVIAVRLENIKLRNKLRRHEQLIRQKVWLSNSGRAC